MGRARRQLQATPTLAYLALPFTYMTPLRKVGSTYREGCFASANPMISLGLVGCLHFPTAKAASRFGLARSLTANDIQHLALVVPLARV